MSNGIQYIASSTKTPRLNAISPPTPSNDKFGHKKSLTTTYQRPFIKIPLSDLFNQTSNNVNHLTSNTACSSTRNSKIGSSYNNNNRQLDGLSTTKNNEFHVEIPCKGLDIECYDSEIVKSQTIKKNNSTTATSSTNYTRNNSGGSTVNLGNCGNSKQYTNSEANSPGLNLIPLDNTLTFTMGVYGDDKLKNAISCQLSPVKINDIIVESDKKLQHADKSKGRMKKNFFTISEEVKTNPPTLTISRGFSGTGRIIEKFEEAKQKAKYFDDQVIKQYQFERNNKEEEENFLELVNELQNKIQ